MDMTMTKALGEKQWAEPTDSAKSGTKKRCTLVDRRGIPIGLAVEGANRHDIKLAEPTLESIPVDSQSDR